MYNWILAQWYTRSRGQGMIEYGLIIALVAVVVIATLVLLGPQIKNLFDSVSANL
jgi:pilus assembly protein Flp/PilA